jgi:hypothetical protein
MTLLRGLLNNYEDTATSAIGAGDTLINVNSASAIVSLLASDVDFVPVTLNGGSAVEIVHCTAATATTLTVTRAQEGTSAQAFAINSLVEVRATVLAYKEFTEWEPVNVIDITTPVATIDVPLLSGSYKIVFDQIVPNTNVTEVRMQQRKAGTGSFASSQYYQSGRSGTDTVDATNQASNAMYITVMKNMVGTDELYGEVEIPDVDSGGNKHYRFNFCQDEAYTYGSGRRQQSEAIDAVQFSTNLGGFSAGSRIIVYRRAH